MKRYFTEYTGDDGARWAGPLILADSPDMADAINVCLRGPNGEPLTILGEVVLTVPLGNGDTQTHVRHRN